MSNALSQARPYAKAVFEAACEQKKLDEWTTALLALSRVASDPQMIDLMRDPEIPPATLVQIFKKVCGKYFNAQAQRLVDVLLDNHRLMLLVELAAAYQRLLQAHQKTVQAQVTSATPLTPAYLERLQKALGGRLKLKVSFDCKVDPHLMAGAYVQIDDQVIDASLLGRLDRLRESLMV